MSASILTVTLEFTSVQVIRVA